MGKLSNSRGETLTETLVAILIAVRASMMLLTAAIAASNINRAAAAADADLRAQQEVVERQDEVNGIAYVTIEDELASMELLCFSRVIDQCGSYMQVNTPVLVKGRLSVRDEKPPQIMCDSLYPLESGLPPMEQPSRRPTQRESTIYLRFPSADSPAFRHIKLVMTMFEGSTPVKIRLADTGKLLGTHCLNHPALLQECREWLGEENVVVKEK